MDQQLSGKTIAIVIANGFDEAQMAELQRTLGGAGAKVQIVSPENNLVNGWHGKGWGHYFPVDASLSTTLAVDFDGAIFPGGSRSATKLANNPHTKRILRSFMDGARPVVMVGHAIGLLAAADRAVTRTVATVEDVTETVTTAGATVTESETGIVRDEQLMTAADTVDLETLKADVVALFAEEVHQDETVTAEAA